MLYKLVIDENVKKIVSAYINHKFIAIRMTKLTYGKILKEGYFVNLDIGGILILIGILLVLTQVRAIEKYRHPLAEQIDEECNQPDALWVNDFRIYLTKSFLVSVYGGKLTVLDLAAESNSWNRWDQTERLLWITPFMMQWKPDLIRL